MIRLDHRSRFLATILTGVLASAGLGAQTIGGMNPQGAITQWLILGPYGSVSGCNLPGNFDYLTDGQGILGDEWEPKTGDTVASDCNGAAACTAYWCLLPTGVGAYVFDPSLDCNDPELKPKVAFFDSPDTRGYIDYIDTYSGTSTNTGNGGSDERLNNSMAYAWTYLMNNTGQDLEMMIGHNSDDSYRILVNHQELASGNTCRAPDPGGDQDTLGPVTIKDGLNVIMHQTWEGGGNWGFRLRLYDASTLTPISSPDFEIRTAPDFYVVRSFASAFIAGDFVTVNIDIQNAGPPPNQAEIREVLPLGWHAESPSDPGTIEIDATGHDVVVWKLAGPVDSQTLSYELAVPSPFANVIFKGGTVVYDGIGTGIFGEKSVTGGVQGNITEGLAVWVNMPFPKPPNGPTIANPGLAFERSDWITDGNEINEQTVIPVLGETVSPDFGGASPSPGPVNCTSLTWQRKAGACNIDLNSTPEYDNSVAYLAFYAVNPTGRTLKVLAASASDDSEQILIDGKEVWIHDIGRGATCSMQDRSASLDLTPGKHLIIQKVFEGGGGFNAAFRFEDADFNPIADIRYTLDPGADSPSAGDPAYSGGAASVLRKVPKELEEGQTGTISLNLRIKTPPVVGALIEETVPAGFTISNITGGGVQAGQKITWNLGGNLVDTDLSYRVSVPTGCLDSAFQGTAKLGAVQGAIAGDQVFNRCAITATGFIKQWLVLGPLDTSGIWDGDDVDPNINPDAWSATPENGDIRLDYLMDATGTVTEKSIRPFDGMRIQPAYHGDGISSGAKSNGLKMVTRACAPLDPPDGKGPTWEKVSTNTGTFDNNGYFGGEIDAHTTYAVAYVTNTTGAPIATNVAFNSDDAFIVFLDGVEIGVYEPGPCSNTACGRGYGGEDTVVEVFPVTLDPGEHFLLTRVHDGGGGSGHRLRFQDGAGVPLLPPAITVSTRSTKTPPAAYVRRSLSSKTYRPGGPPITVTLRVETSAARDVAIKEVLPAGFTANAITDGGASVGGQINWTLLNVNGVKEVKYNLVAGDCGGGGSWCGNGLDASEYTVGGTSTHALKGQESFSSESSGNDDLGPWDVRDIGTIGGSTLREGDHAASLGSKGNGVRSTKDEFRFVSIPASGDFAITTKINCVDTSGTSMQAGLMVRDTFDTFSAQCFLFVQPAITGGFTLKASSRKDTKKTSSAATVAIADRDVADLPVWLKLARTGAKISFQRSDNGVDYREVATRDIAATGTNVVNLRTDTIIGLGVSAGCGGVTAVADLREVSGPAFIPEVPNAPSLTSATGGAKQVSLSWTAPGAGPAPTAYTINRGGAGGPYTKVAEVPSSQTTYVDTGLADSTNYCYVVRSKRGSSESVNSTERCASTTGGGSRFRRGDVDATSAIDINDPVLILGYLFLGAGIPQCLEAADTDDNGEVDITDAVNNLGYQFLGGPAPDAPGPINCGPDGSAPFLGCNQACP